MNKKKIISQTMMFIFIIAFIIVFKSFFGDENTLIGVTVITASLMLLSRDLTLNPIKNILILIGVNVFSGLLAYFSNFNVISGAICNLIAMFLIGYLFCYNLKAAVYVPFGLQYMFMLSVQVTSKQLPIRLMSLLIGAFIIMLFQLLFNKNKVQKVSRTTLCKICDLLCHKINGIIENSDVKDINENIQRNINIMRELISDRKESHFYITKEGKILLDVSIALNRLNKILHKIRMCGNSSKCEEFLIDLSIEIRYIKSIINNENNISEMKNRVDKVLHKYKVFFIEDEYCYEAISVLNFIKENLINKDALKKKEKYIIHKNSKLPETFKLKYLLKINFNRDSAKFCYAVRISVVFTLAAFIAQYFKLSEGKWIYFTVYSVTQPYLEITNKKAIDRLKGTIIGIIIFLILFTIIKDSNIRIFMVTAVGYIMGYTERYDVKMIFITISALGVAAVSGNLDVLALYRFEDILLGAIIAILANKFILPFKVEDGTKELLKINYKIVKEMLNEISLTLNGKGNEDYARNLLLVSSQVEDKIIGINESFKSIKLGECIKSQRETVEDLYCLFFSINQLDNNDNIKDIIKTYVEKFIIHLRDKDYIEEKSNYKLEINRTKNINERLILSSLHNLYEDISTVKNLHLVNSN